MMQKNTNENQKTSLAFSLSLPVAGIIIFLAIAIVYANSLKTPFYYDDIPLISENQAIRNLDNLPRVFNKKQYYQLFNQPTYRPITAVLYILLYPVLGLSPMLWRLFSLTLHLANCWLLFLLLRRFKLSDSFALLCTVVFAVHTVNTEIINVISFNADLLGSFFCLLAFYAYFRKTIPWRVLSVLSFLLSCFTKETFIVLPLLLILFDWLDEERFDLSKTVIKQLWYLAAVLICLYVKFYLMKSNYPSSYVVFPGNRLVSALLTFSVVLIYYLKIFIVPLGLTPVYSFPKYTSLLNWQVGISLALLSLIAILVIYGVIKRKKYSLYLTWFFLFLLPTSNIIPFWTTLAERFLYLPLMGLITGVLLIIKAALENWEPHGRSVFYPIMIIFIILLSVSTIRRNAVWQDPEALWLTAAMRAPNSAIPHGNLGAYYFSNGELDKAITEYKLIIKDFPLSYPNAYYFIGKSYYKQGKYLFAKEYYEKAVSHGISAMGSKYKQNGYYYSDIYTLGVI